MDPVTILNVLSRFVHLLTAIVLLGGSCYVRFVLMPAAGELPPAEHDALRGRLMVRWKKIVMAGIGLLLATGFYNYIAVAIPGHKGQPAYHALMGVKILLAFGAFFLASALTGRAAAFEPIRRNARLWLLTLIVVSTIVVGIGSVLKVALPGRTPGSAPQEPASRAQPHF